MLIAFSKLFDFLAGYVGKKIAAGGAMLATSLALLTALYLVIRGLIVGLVSQVSNPLMLQAFYLVWPSNAELCISAYWSAQVAVYVYREHRENLRSLAYIT